LTGLLLKFLKKSHDPTIINVSSDAQKYADYAYDYFAFTSETFRIWKMYANSKASKVLFSEALKELSETKSVNTLKSIAVRFFQ
jgi:NAD(P)-dependent dehydrogenase (short-subunit alcohol dehydrogenase family)